MRNLPFKNFEHNQVWLWLVMLAQDIVAWTRQLCLADQARASEAQAAAIPPATPIRTDRPPRPQNDPAALPRLALGTAARRRVQAPASAPTPNRLWFASES